MLNITPPPGTLTVLIAAQTQDGDWIGTRLYTDTFPLRQQTIDMLRLKLSFKGAVGKARVYIGDLDTEAGSFELT